MIPVPDKNAERWEMMAQSFSSEVGFIVYSQIRQMGADFLGWRCVSEYQAAVLKACSAKIDQLPKSHAPVHYEHPSLRQ